MKSPIPRLILLSALLGLPAFAAEAPKVDPYTEAVAAYVTSAGDQLRAIRSELNAATKDATSEVKRKYAGVYADLDRLDKLTEGLKAALAKDFDRLKADFEHQREAMIKGLEKVRQGG